MLKNAMTLCALVVAAQSTAASAEYFDIDFATNAGVSNPAPFNPFGSIYDATGYRRTMQYYPLDAYQGQYSDFQQEVGRGLRVYGELYGVRFASGATFGIDTFTLGGGSGGNLLISYVKTNGEQGSFQTINPIAGEATYRIGLTDLRSVTFSIFMGNFLLRSVAGAVPEPATWSMMLAGFGLTGYALRRRRSRVAFA